MSSKIKGILIPVGGNEDKGIGDQEIYTRDFISEGILWSILNAAEGVHSKVVIVPTASGIPDKVALDYLGAFEQLGCDHVKVLEIKSKGDAEKDSYCTELASADCIMMSGGDQSKLVNAFSGTRSHDILKDRLKNEKIVIAGTSAGAMAMSLEMISGGSSEESLVKGAVKMRDGLGLMPGLIIDSHFIRRGRFGRLAEAVARFPQLLGIGLAEDTGVIIREGNAATVIGSGMVVLFDPGTLSHNKHEVLQKGTPMSMGNLITHILSNGDQFNIDKRTLKVLPLHEHFL